MLRRCALLLPAIAGLFFATTALAGRPTVRSAVGRIIFHRYQRSQLELRGRVLDGNGNVQVGVPVTVAAYPTGGGFFYSRDGVTDRTGRYGLYVPRGPSRVVYVYAGSSTIEIREIVSPGLWIYAKSRRRGLVRFTGGLTISRDYPLPTVLLQDKTPVGWQTFGAVTPSARSHRWRYVYRAAATSRGFRYAFRSATLSTSQWAPGVSRTVWAVVR